MGIEIKTSSSDWLSISNPQIYNFAWENVNRGEIWNGTSWITFYTRLEPVAPIVAQFSRGETSLTFSYSHPGDTQTGTPVSIVYQLETQGGSIISGPTTTSPVTGSISSTVTFPGLSNNTTYVFKAFASYPSYGEISTTSSIQYTTLPPQPTYSITASPLSINEGQSTTISVSTTNVPNGTILYWRIDHITTSNADFSGSTSGTRTINNNSGGSFTITALADQTTEGDETFTVGLYTDDLFELKVANTAVVTVVDTSTTPPPPTYSITANPLTIDEGQSTTISISTTNVPNGTILYWRIIHGTTNNADFTTSTSGQRTINNNTTTNITITAAEDESTEGDETFSVALFLDSNYFLQVDITDTITIKDTSTTPVFTPNEPGLNFITNLTTDTSMQWRATHPESTVTYTITLEFLHANNQIIETRIIGPRTSAANVSQNFTGLSPLTVYRLRGFTVYDNGISSDNVTSSRATVRRPTIPTTTGITGSSATFTSTSGTLSNIQNEGRIRFEVRYASNNASYGTFDTLSSNTSNNFTLSRQISGLPASTQFRVRGRTLYPSYGSLGVVSPPSAYSNFTSSSGGIS